MPCVIIPEPNLLFKKSITFIRWSEGYRFLSGTGEDNRKSTIPISNQIGNKTCQFVNNQDSVTGGDGARFFLNASTAQISFDAEL